MSIEDKIYTLLKYYNNLPESLKAILGFYYLKLPESIKYGRSYTYFKKLLENESCLQDFYEEYQDKEFRKVLFSAKKTTFYRSFYNSSGINIDSLRGLDDIHKLPLISKEIVQKNIDDMIVPGMKKKGLYLTTGGSTGEPLGFYLEKGVTRPKEKAFIEYLWNKVGYKPGDKCALFRGHVLHTQKGKIYEKDYLRNWIYLSSYEITCDKIEKYIEALNGFQPKFIQGYPSYLELFSKYLTLSEKKLDFIPACILAGSENLYPYQREIIEDVFKCKIYSWYGHSERLVLGVNQANSIKFNFNPFYGYMEIIDNNL